MLHNTGTRWFGPRSPARFLLVGMINTILGLAVIWGAKRFIALTDAAANIAGYVVALAASFLLNRRWTFAFRENGAASLLRFLVVFAVAYVANLGTVLALIDVTSLNAMLCQALGVAPYSTLFYLGCRWYAFPVRHATEARPAAAGRDPPLCVGRHHE
jgi:putative flippase GtrA